MDEVEFDDAEIEIVKPKNLKRPSSGPSPFEISLMTYPVQPWINRKVNLNQWFNYGLNPTTWTKYAISQINIFNESNK